jgi:hypothetical protein
LLADPRLFGNIGLAQPQMAANDSNEPADCDVVHPASMPGHPYPGLAWSVTDATR